MKDLRLSVRLMMRSPGFYGLIVVTLALGSRQRENNGLENAADPAIYFVHRQFPYRTMSVVIKGEGEVQALAGILRDQVQRLDPGFRWQR